MVLQPSLECLDILFQVQLFDELYPDSDWIYHGLVAQVQRTSTFRHLRGTYVEVSCSIREQVMALNRQTRLYEMRRLVLTTSREGVVFLASRLFYGGLCRGWT